MKRVYSVVQWFRAALVVLPLLFTGCMKGGDMLDPEMVQYSYLMDAGESLAVGTVRVREERWYVQLDEKTAGYVANQSKVRDIADGTRVCLQFRYVVGYMPGFCTDAILVEWISPIEVGEIRLTMDAPQGEPISIVNDWITSLEDGFLTLHYRIQSKGKAAHTFALYPGAKSDEFRLVHEAHGDSEGDLVDGIVCFPVSSFDSIMSGSNVGSDGNLNSVTISYLNIDNTQKTLTFESRNPQ